jgi:hypothetical protein
MRRERYEDLSLVVGVALDGFGEGGSVGARLRALDDLGGCGRRSGERRILAAMRLVLLRHKLRRKRSFVLAAQHGQRERLATSSMIRRRRRVAIEFTTWRSGRSGGASGSITFG